MRSPLMCIEPDQIVGELWAKNPVVRFSVEVEAVRREATIEVTTHRRSNATSQVEVVTVNCYRLPQNENMNAID